VHEARDRGVAHLDTDPDPVDPEFPLVHLIDGLPSRLFRFETSPQFPNVDLDRGSGSLVALDRLVIPAGNQLASTVVYRVRDSAVSVFSSSTILASFNGTFGGLLDIPLSPSASQQFLRIQDEQSDINSPLPMTELWYTQTVIPTRGPDPDWEQTPEARREVVELATGASATVVLGPQQDFIQIRFNGLSGSSFTALNDGLASVGFGAETFLFWPPDDRFGPRIVRLLDASRPQDSRSPKGTGPTYRWELTMREVT